MYCTEASIDTFVNEVRNFETDEGSQWNRGNLSPTTQEILRSQWTNWGFRDHDTDWKSTPSLKFFEFMKAVQHSYFPYSTPDSSYVEAVTRIVQVLEKEPIKICPLKGVRPLQQLAGRFNAANVLECKLAALNPL